MSAPVEPSVCKHESPDSFGIPDVGELLWCSQCGSVSVVSKGHQDDWEIPARSRMGTPSTDLGDLLKPHGRWDLRSPGDDGLWHAYPAYQTHVMGVGRTVLLAVQDALAQMTGYPEGIMTRKVKGKCRGCGRGMKVMIAECELGFFFRKCRFCQNGNYIDVTDGVAIFK